MDIIFPLITLVIGTFLGLLTSVLVAYLQHKHDINIKIVDQFFEARGQLCDTLSTLAGLQIVKDLDITQLSMCREEISKLFYKYYDFFPEEVLKEMLCLYACLSDKENRLYKHQDNCLLLMDDHDVMGLIRRISLVDNFKYYAINPLKSANLDKRRAASVNYQARGVLNTINRHFTIQKLLSWNRHLQKSKKVGSNLNIQDILQKEFVKVYGNREQAVQQISVPNKQLSLSVDSTTLVVTTVSQTIVKKQLIAIIATIIGIEEEALPLDASLYEIGIDSLTMIEIHHRANKVFGVSLPIRTLLQGPTIRKLITEIEEQLIPPSL